jgi:hypothetical protein
MKELSTALLTQYIPASKQEGSPLTPLPDAADRASRYVGHYQLAGTPQQDFFKLEALMYNVNVNDNGDGSIRIGSKQYVEVEPLLFQSQTDPTFFVVFVEDESGDVAWLTFGGTGSYQKVRWHQTSTTQFALVAFMLLSFLSFIVVMPFSRQRHWLIWLMSLISLLFLVGLAYMMFQADIILLYKMIPLGTRLLFLLPLLSGVLALTYPWVIVDLWRKRPLSRIWFLYLLNMVSAVVFIWFVNYWHLYLF